MGLQAFHRGESRRLMILLGLFLALALWYSIAVPLFEGPDEDDHFRYVKYLADTRALPVQQFVAGGGPAGHQGWQPPLYYALGAVVIAPVDTSDFADRLWRNPAASYQGDPACCGRNLYFHTAAESMPYRDTTLAVHLVRLLSILFGLVTVAATYLLARGVFASEWPALAAAALVAFNPSFLFASALVSNDAPTAAFSSLALLACAQLLWGRRRLDARSTAFLALWIALAILSKTTGLGLLPFAAVVLGWCAYRDTRPRGPSAALKPFVRYGLLLAVIVLALTGWYFVRNWTLYGDPFALRLINASAIFPRESPLTWAELTRISLPWLWRTFWGGPVPGDLAAPILYALTALCAVAAIGVASFAVRAARSRAIPVTGLGHPTLAEPQRDQAQSKAEIATAARTRLAMTEGNLLVQLLLAAWLAFIFVAQVQFMRTSGGTDQGRYLFPAISSFAVLTVLGLRELAARFAPRALLPAVAAPLLAFAVYVPLAYVAPAYAPAVRVQAGAVAQAQAQVNADFADKISLRGYDLSTRQLHRGDSLRVTLYWQSLQRVDRSYRVFVHLVDEAGRVAGGKDVIPGRGAYATVLWQPGEWVRDEMVVPTSGDAFPGRYQLEIGLYPFGEPDNRVNLANSEEDRVLIDSIEVVP